MFDPRPAFYTLIGSHLETCLKQDEGNIWMFLALWLHGLLSSLFDLCVCVCVYGMMGWSDRMGEGEGKERARVSERD